MDNFGYIGRRHAQFPGNVLAFDLVFLHQPADVVTVHIFTFISLTLTKLLPQVNVKKYLEGIFFVMDKKLAKIIVKRMIDAAGLKTQEQLADLFGIKPQSVSSSISSGRVPDGWFDLMLEKYGATRDELCRPPQKVSMSLEQNWGNNATGNAGINAEGCYTVNLNQGGTGQGITMQLTEREAMLIERLRIYGNQVTWAQIEAALDKIEQASR